MSGSQSDRLSQLDEIERRIVRLGNELRQAEQERAAIVRRVLADKDSADRPDSQQKAKLLFTADEASVAMSVCRKTLYRLSKPRGPIPVVSIGQSGIRYSVEAIRHYIEQQETADKSK